MIGYWDLVVNRLYYAVFHAVNAMLMESTEALRKRICNYVNHKLDDDQRCL